MEGHDTVTTPPGRRLARVDTLPAPSPGFVGAGHTAVQVIGPSEFGRCDPFIMLADDRLDLAAGRRAGGPHPHAGFEIATLVVEGAVRDGDEGLLAEGDIAWTTAGTGVIHGEDLEPLGPVRILQLWVTSPSHLRWSAPRFEHVARRDVPVRREAGVEATVYSGASGTVHGGDHLHLPLTIIDVRLEAGATFVQELPISYAGFLYPLRGEVVVVGQPERPVSTGQVGWLDHQVRAGALALTAGSASARFVVYAGERQGVAIATKGPFVGETPADLARVGRHYVAGGMPRLRALRRP